jgi:general secretion pathway protein M
MSATGLTSMGSFRRRWLALLTYVILLVGLTAVAVATISNLLDSYAALDKNRAILARLDRQMEHTMGRQFAASTVVKGPPFLGGKTITIAGAALQERVEAAVKKAGGNVLSSQIDLQGPRSAEGFVGLTESLEIDQASLQPLLYDLEAGMPYLFVENLAIQAPQAFGEAEGTPMRVLMAVSGQWREPQ